MKVTCPTCNGAKELACARGSDCHPEGYAPCHGCGGSGEVERAPAPQYRWKLGSRWAEVQSRESDERRWETSERGDRHDPQFSHVVALLVMRWPAPPGLPSSIPDERALTEVEAEEIAAWLRKLKRCCEACRKPVGVLFVHPRAELCAECNGRLERAVASFAEAAMERLMSGGEP